MAGSRPFQSRPKVVLLGNGDHADRHVAERLGDLGCLFFPLHPIDQKRIIVLVHSAVAVLAVCGVIIHVSIVLWERGTLQAMTRGYVTGGWAWKHHRNWLRELVTGGRVDAYGSGAG